MVNHPQWLIDSLDCIGAIETQIRLERLAVEREMAANRLRTRLLTKHIKPAPIADLPGFII